MKTALLLPILILAAYMSANAQTAAELADIWEKEQVSKLLPSNVRHRDLVKYLEGLKKLDVKVEEAGRSLRNRAIYQIEFGRGPLRVFLWSQMHGDEPTATSALIDMFTVLQNNRDKEWVKNIEKTMAIRAVPMLNPDGAELYLRRNAQGIDINRDAVDLKTPEANLLKKMRDEWSPDIGFNLHNQNALTTAGKTNKQAAISFLVVYGDAEKTLTPGLERNRRIVAGMTEALNNFIPGHIGRYDDEWSPTAFGDNFSAWGTPVILIETGALHGRDEMFLVKMNFVAFLTALKSIADGSEKSLKGAIYDVIPKNSSGRIMNFIFRNASIIDRAKHGSFLIADIGVNVERRRAEQITPAHIRQIGDLSAIAGLAEYDAADFNVVTRFQPFNTGSLAKLLFYRKNRTVNWTSTDIEKEFPPDAIFSLGKWIKGEGVIRAL